MCSYINLALIAEAELLLVKEAQSNWTSKSVQLQFRTLHPKLDERGLWVVGTRSAHCNDVVPGFRERNSLPLDRRGQPVALPLDGTKDLWLQVHVLEGPHPFLAAIVEYNYICDGFWPTERNFSVMCGGLWSLDSDFAYFFVGSANLA